MATIGPVAPAVAAPLQAGMLGMQDFLKILLTQMTYQDPLKPMDNQAFMAQMAQFTALQQTQELNGKVDALLATQAALQSVGLIGRTIDVATDAGVVSGSVVSLDLSGASATLTLRTVAGATLNAVPLSRIVAVR